MAPTHNPPSSSAPWVEKYRPETLDDVAAHKEIITTSTYGCRVLCVRARARVCETDRQKERKKKVGDEQKASA